MRYNLHTTCCRIIPCRQKIFYKRYYARRYKRIISLSLALILLGILTGTFAFVWYTYYSETIVLPFDVQRISHESKGAMVPFAAWQQTDGEKPFWLYALGSGGWEAAATIRAYEPYIISMPNNDRYRDVYRVNGNVTFAAENVRVKKTDVAAAVSGGGKTLVPNFRSQSASSEVFALNVVNDYSSETAGAAAGSQFVRQLRPVHPFEAYLIANNMTRGDVIPVFEEYSTTNVVDNEIMRNLENEEWYSDDGRKLEGKPTRKGVYIKNRKTVVVK